MHTVSYMNKNTSFEVENDKIIFDALQELGEELPHGCLSGSCGACKVQIISGENELSQASAIEKDTIEAVKNHLKRVYGDQFDPNIQIRLSCRAKVQGDIEFKTL